MMRHPVLAVLVALGAGCHSSCGGEKGEKDAASQAIDWDEHPQPPIVGWGCSLRVEWNGPGCELHGSFETTYQGGGVESSDFRETLGCGETIKWCGGEKIYVCDCSKRKQWGASTFRFGSGLAVDGGGGDTR
jgi:hypothetical protein